MTPDPKLPSNTMLYYSDHMDLHEVQQVTLVLGDATLHELENKARAQFKDGVLPNVRQEKLLQLSFAMTAQLSSHDFKITEDDKAAKRTLVGPTESWSWSIEPRTSGDRKFAKIKIFAIPIRNALELPPFEVADFDVYVNVDEGVTSRFSRYLSGNSPAVVLLTVLATVLMGVAAVRREISSALRKLKQTMSSFSRRSKRQVSPKVSESGASENSETPKKDAA